MSKTEILFIEEKGNITSFDVPEKDFAIKTESGIDLFAEILNVNGYKTLRLTAIGDGKGYFSVKHSFENATPVVFSGEKKNIHEIYRQSPHDPADHVIDMAKEAVPMAGIKKGNNYFILCSDSPFKYNNYTTQEISDNFVAVSSGDSGLMPGYQGNCVKEFYHEITKDAPHDFEVVFLETKAPSHNKLLNKVFMAIDSVWGYNSNSPYKALCFATNYMLLRVNETNYSNIWVTPGIIYVNKQYTRDAFWQSMMFDLDIQQECYDAVYEERYKYAESGLFYIIWSYRMKLCGGKINEERLKDACEYVNNNSVDGKYIASNDTPDHQLAFKCWCDTCSYGRQDVITYNQSLFVCALMCAEKMGITLNTSVEDAKREYKKLYSEENKCFKFSAEKGGMSVDGTVGDLLARLYLNEGIIEDKYIIENYKTVSKKSATRYGFKVNADENGNYPPLAFYMAEGYLYASHNDYRLPGFYQWGGSWHLYEMLFNLNGCVVKADNAEKNSIKRVTDELGKYGTYYEFIDTVTGIPHRENQGWNACICALWEMAVKQGKVTDKYLKKADKSLI